MAPGFLGALLILGAGGPVLAGLFPLGTAAPGSVPGAINYQGTLADNGFPVNGIRQMSFRIYDSPIAGTLLWSGASAPVSFDQGYFTAAVAASTAVFSRGTALFLEVQVDSTVLSPRDPLNSKSYALLAKTLEGSLDVAGGALSVASSLSVSSRTGNVGIGTANPQSALDVRGVIGAGGSGISITAGGNVGVGTASPASAATVAGDLRLVGAGAVVFPDATQQTTALVLGTPSSVSSPGAAVIVADSQGTGSGDAALQTGAAPADRLRVFNRGVIGIGSVNPAASLHLSSGAFIIDGTSPVLAAGPSNFYLSAGGAGIGTLTPAALVDDVGPAQFGSGAAKSTVTSAGNIQLVAGSTIASAGVLSISTAAAAAAGAAAIFIDSKGQTGVQTPSPAAQLDVNGTAAFGSAAKSLFDPAGNPQLASGSTISSNGTLSISTAATAALTGVPALFLDASGNVGVGTAAPGALFEVASSTGALLRARGGAAGSAGLAVVKGIGAQTGAAVCGTGACLAYWAAAGANVGCGASTPNGRALCAGFGD